MIVSTYPAGEQKIRITVPHFTHSILENNDQTDVYWWNKSDHTVPFPWDARQTTYYLYSPSTLARFRTDIQQFDPVLGITLNKDILNTNDNFNFTFTGSSGIYTYNLSLMAVDATGGDLFDFYNPTAGDRPQHFNGIYLKQTVGSDLTLIRNFKNFKVFWIFSENAVIIAGGLPLYVTYPVWPLG